MSYAENYKEIVWAPLPERNLVESTKSPEGPYFVPDIKEFVAPGKVLIGSRSKLREYERSTGTRQCGELKTPQDFAPPPPKIDQRRIDEAVGTAIQRVLG